MKNEKERPRQKKARQQKLPDEQDLSGERHSGILEEYDEDMFDADDAADYEIYHCMERERWAGRDELSD